VLGHDLLLPRLQLDAALVLPSGTMLWEQAWPVLETLLTYVHASDLFEAQNTADDGITFATAWRACWSSPGHASAQASHKVYDLGPWVMWPSPR
jgi:hypothetical protein